MDYKPNKAYIAKKGDLVFENSDGPTRACSEGFFFIKMPETFNVNPLEKMADNFFKEKSESLNGRDNAYRGYKKGNSDDASQGFYVDRENNQCESFYSNREAFIKHPNILPLELKTPVTEMLNISVLVLKYFLNVAGIPSNLWAEATNGVFDESIPEFRIGFNHYRSDKKALGAIPHKDGSWVTILYSVEPGLQAYINNNWVPINPIDGFFTVNVGSGLDVLTKNAKKHVVASMHQVIQQNNDKKDRFSVALFFQPAIDNDFAKLYSYDHDTNKLVYQKSYKEFNNELMKRYDNSENKIKHFNSENLTANLSEL